MEHNTMPEVISLWPERPSGAEEGPRQEQETIYPRPRFNNLVRNMKVVRNITESTLAVYHPDPALANGTAVIICPGGGFLFLPIEHEGTEVARWLNAREITAYVLRYRLMPTAPSDEDFFQHFQRPPIERIQADAQQVVLDGKQAIRLVREHAAAWGIDPERIGLLGFSAGGMVAAGVATQYEAESRPGFVGAIYSPCWSDVSVPEDAPPLFLAFASDDPILSLVLEGSLRFYHAWQSAGHPVELHSYTKGGTWFWDGSAGLSQRPLD